MRVRIGGFVAAMAVCVIGCGDDASKTIAALVPAGAAIHEENSESIGDVTFTHVEYGEQMDCAAGCFSSHLCAIEDGEQVLLYHAAWNQASEAPKGVETMCPGLQGMSTSGCETPGKKHPAGSSAELKEFLSEQRTDGGPFRWCVE